MFGLVWKNKKTIKWIENHEKQIKTTSIIIGLFTIFSFMFAIFTFYYQQNKELKIQEENKKIFIENARAEIDTNNLLISTINKDIENYINTSNLPLKIFIFDNLQRLENEDLSVDLRRDIIFAVDTMQQVNRILNRLWGTQINLIPIEASNSYYKLRKANLENIKTYSNDLIKTHLDSIEDRLNK